MSNDGMTVRIVYKCFKVINYDKKHKYTVSKIFCFLNMYPSNYFNFEINHVSLRAGNSCLAHTIQLDILEILPDINTLL